MSSNDAFESPRDASKNSDDSVLLYPNGHSWPRPRTPLHPHRLAKLANALGISAPVPLSQSTGESTPSSYSLSKPSSEPRLSPTPSLLSANSRSKFLLHVVPPSHIPHDSDSADTFELTAPPSTASGYHTQFKRGTLVPLFPHSREYALPSTTGMILYLISSAPNPSPDTDWAVPDGPGPRLSDDIWKHLWTRVVNFEIETYSRATTPNTAGLGFSYGDRSSPLYAQEFLPSSGTLRPLISPGRVTPQSFTYPLTPTGSSASSNILTHSAPSEISQSEINSPDTSSLAPDSRAATLDLPGLTSPSVIPILAKVEFDIDKQRAAWYDPWIRSRKLNHQKRDQRTRTRTQSESGTSLAAGDDGGRGGEAEVPKAAPLPLRLVDRQAIPRFLLSADERQEDTQEAEYIRLSESPLSHEDVDPSDVFNPPPESDRDSLPDVFGANRDTLTDRETNPNVVQLVLDEQPLSDQAKVEGDLENGIDEEEVQVLQDSLERPKLSLGITSTLPDPTGRSSLTIAVTETVSFRKAAPPPLTLMPNAFHAIASGEPSPFLSTGSTRLAYLGDGSSPHSEDDLSVEEGMQGDSTETNGKDESATDDGSLFADLDLALDLGDIGEFDENDPNDRRRSQYVFKAQLDEIEKALVRFSPRGLQHETKSQESPTKSPPWSSSIDDSSSAPALSVGASKRSPRDQSTNDLSEKPAAVWPAVPYSSLSQELDEVETPFGLDDFPAPPKLALNGVSNDIPISPYSKALSGMHNFESEESKARKRDVNGHEPTYSESVPHLRKPVSSNTPVIPLSPDPFGRFPSIPTPPLPTSEDSESPEQLRPQARIKYSTFGIPPERHSSLLSYSDEGTVVSHTDPVSAPPSSRFSLDSTDEGKNNRTGSTSLNPVKSIKSLWRKNRKSSVSAGPGSAPPSWTGSGRASPPSLFPLPNLPGPSVQRSPTPTSLSASRESVASLVSPADRYPPKVQPRDTPKSPPRLVREGSSTSMVFDQESPYPVLVQQSQRQSSSRPRASQQPNDSLSPTSLTNRSSVRHSETPTESDATLPHALSPTDRERTGAPKSILKPWRSDNSASPPLPEQFAARTRRSRGGSEAYASKFPAMGTNRVSASIESTRTSPPRRPNRGTLRKIPSQDMEALKMIESSPHPGRDIVHDMHFLLSIRPDCSIFFILLFMSINNRCRL
ncbi:hypothetical protein EI94DRAFT_1783354 [Lactarius quietus]|nr:hypothetical protein EI94DRAFT_1783354 [Lactarius quietus]